ncbi:glutathione-dependent formaldehyde-activating GFA [Ruegeria sp. TM1040]|uniref:GFA family protein n=1 Tax=Ruegeria sp. (strain TM1040) TaxID=292414 RepID=UPI0000557AD3|nr:GFA family protein [Ruegeria sp. TM1040]ABF63255.1 glutathione-dependent formaldehyde-activating GFA [Ruegeria sp. TM1040]
MSEVTASCLCGDIRVRASGSPIGVGLCHCMDCRKHHGAVFWAAAVYPAEAVEVFGQTQQYQGRHFCPRCGSSVYSCSEGEVELHLGAMDQPNQFTPTYELWTDRREHWLTPLARAHQHSRNRGA